MNYKYYISDSVTLIIDKLKDLEIQLQKCKTDELDYIQGQIFAHYDTLTLLQSQAEAFDIPLSDIGLENLNLEKYLTLG